MRKGSLIKLLVLVGIAAFLIWSFFWSFGPYYDNEEIKQHIGGTLICKSVYYGDHHSWLYDVTYKYKLNNDSVINIGNGTYYGREWNKDEQLVTYKNWIILKTGGGHGTDKIIVGKLNSKKWTEYEFTPQNIERDSLWQISKTSSLLNWCCSQCIIKEINTGRIVVGYKFRTNETPTDQYGTRKIYYLIDEATGKPEMVKVE